MNILVKWSIKRYVLKAVNTALEAGKDKVQTVIGYVDIYIGYAEKVIEFLKSLKEKLADNKITDEESDAIVAEAEVLVNTIVR